MNRFVACMAAVLPVLALALAGVFAATGETGKVQVVVHAVTARGARQPMSGAQVTLAEEGTPAPARAQATGPDGLAEFPALPAGDGYVVSVTAVGRLPLVKRGVRVAPGTTTVVEFGLLPELTQETTVKARRPMVELDGESAASTTISGDEFQDLPIFGRDYQSVLTLAPGVQDSDGDGNPNVLGSRDRDFRMAVDGVSNVDPLTGYYLSNLNPDAIEELEIVGTGADASFGRAVGGFGRITTKSGGNKYEGSLNVFLADSLFDGDGAGGRDPMDFHRLQPSIYVSGPIVRDALWFAANHELIQMSWPTTVLHGASFTQQMDGGRHLDRLTWQASPRHKVQLTWSADPMTVAPDGVGPLVPPSSGYRQVTGGPTTAVKWSALFSPTFSWQTTAAFSDTKLEVTPYDLNARNACVMDDPTVNPFTYLAGYNCADGTRDGRVSGPYQTTHRDKRQRWSYSLDAEQFVEHWLGGQHQIKTGLSLERARYQRDLTVTPSLQLNLAGPVGRPGAATVNGGSPFGGDPTAYLLSSTSAYFPSRTFIDVDSMLQSQRGADVSLGNYYAAYITDTYQPRNNVSVSVGLRFSREELTSDGYQSFDPRAERGRYENAVRSGVATCVAQMACADQGRYAQVCYQTCIEQAALLSEGLFTVHPLDDPNLVTLPPADAPPGWTPGPSDIPTCSLAINYDICQQLAIVKWHSPFVDPGRLSFRAAETFTIANDNFEPRLRVSWDPWNDGKTRVFSSWGRYYGDTFLLPLVYENGPDMVHRTYALDARKVPIDTNNGAAPLSMFGGAFSVRLVDRNLKRQHSDEWTLGFEREVGPETAVRLQYINRKYFDQLQDMDINHRPITYDEMRHRPSNIYPNGGDCPTVNGYYDCTGLWFRETPAPTPGVPDDPTQPGGTPLPPPTQLPDGVPDLELINPLFNGAYWISNLNSTTYEAAILEVTRRWMRNFEYSMSYTWSRSYGQAEDFNQGLGDDPTIADDEAGPLSFDQTHVVKFYGRMFVPYGGGFRLGGILRWESGLPYSVYEDRSVLDFPTDLSAGETAMYGVSPLTRGSETRRTTYPTGQRNDRRNPSYWTVDVNFQKELYVKSVKTSLQLDVFNLLNDDTIQYLGVLRSVASVGPLGEARVYSDTPYAVRRPGRSFQLAVRMSF